MDCLDGMSRIPSKSIDCVVTDCPYRICSGGVRLVPDGKECGGVLKKQQKVKPTSKLGERWLHNDKSPIAPTELRALFTHPFSIPFEAVGTYGGEFELPK